MPMLVAAAQIHGTNGCSASHWAAPITAPASRPPARAAPTESTRPTITFASSRRSGSPTRMASGHAQTSGRAGRR